MKNMKQPLWVANLFLANQYVFLPA